MSRPWVDVWWYDVPSTALGPDDLLDLSAEERERAERFRFAEDRARYQVSHVMLRRVLAGYTGAAPGELVFGRAACPRCGGPNGRPVLAGHSDVHFSLSHAADLVVIAVAAQRVGVDVEGPPRHCLCQLTGRMHERDRALVEPMSEDERHAAVLVWWTRTEALLKCLGTGIGHGISGQAVLDGVGPAGAGGQVDGHRVEDLPVRTGYGAAVAVAAEAPVLTVRAQA